MDGLWGNMRELPIKMDLEVPPFQETHIWHNMTRCCAVISFQTSCEESKRFGDLLVEILFVLVKTQTCHRERNWGHVLAGLDVSGLHARLTQGAMKWSVMFLQLQFLLVKYIYSIDVGNTYMAKNTHFPWRHPMLAVVPGEIQHICSGPLKPPVPWCLHILWLKNISLNNTRKSAVKCMYWDEWVIWL